MSTIEFKYAITWVSKNGDQRTTYEYGENEDEAYGNFMWTHSRDVKECISVDRVNS